MRKKQVRSTLIKVGIVDDHKAVAEAFEFALTSDKEFSVTFNLNNGSHLLQELYRHPTDVLLLDIKMKGEDGFTLLKKVKEVFPAIKVVMISFHTSEPIIIQSYQIGASGYFCKTSDIEELKSAIRTVYAKKSHIPEIASDALYNQVMAFAHCQDMINSGVSFSDSEKKMLVLVAKGYNNKKIATELELSQHTLFTYRKRMIQKAKCKNMIELIAFVLKHNIIHLP